MDLFLRKVPHPQAHDSCRVIVKIDGAAIEVGSIGLQNTTSTASVWRWGIDAVTPMRSFESEG